MISLDEIFDLLSEKRRRYALYYLEEEDGPVSVEDVAAQVAEWETGDVSATIPEDKLDRIVVEFYHNDLPKASDVEYIEYDPVEEEVKVSGISPEFDAILSIAKVIERPERNP